MIIIPTSLRMRIQHICHRLLFGLQVFCQRVIMQLVKLNQGITDWAMAPLLSEIIDDD